MTTRELAALLGKEAILSLPERPYDGLQVRVRILDAREVFGRMDVLVEPLAGSGGAWVSADRVRVGGQ